MQNQIEISLSNPLQYQSRSAGKVLKANKIILKAPQFKHRDTVLILTQLALSACTSARDNISREKSDNVKFENIDEEKIHDPLGFIMTLQLSKIDIVQFYKIFKELFINDIAFLNDEALTEDLYKQLSLDDLNLMMGEYVINFLLKQYFNMIQRAIEKLKK